MANEHTPGEGPPPLLGRTELIATLFLLAGVVVIVGGIILFAGGGSDDGDQGAGAITGTPIGSASVTAAPGATDVPFEPDNDDEEAIQELARKSIEVLPQGLWPSLYEDFTTEFRGRCSLSEFAQAGVEGAQALGDSLPLLGFKSMKNVTITGDTATGTIVGELRGQSEYEVQASFAREDGAWKLAPAPNTSGCSAFNRLSG